jgi:hypothetical protein
MTIAIVIKDYTCKIRNRSFGIITKITMMLISIKIINNQI